MTFGVLSGAEISAQDFARLGGLRQTALLKVVFARLGEEIGARLAAVMAQEFDSPTRADRVIGLSEAASFLAWALCGHPHAGDLQLAACEILAEPEGPRLILPTDDDPIWAAMQGSFASHLWESLRIGAGLIDVFPTDETITVAIGGVSCGASVAVTAPGGTLVLHFGGILQGDERLGLIETPANAIKGVAADARALSVPVHPGSLAAMVQASLAVDEAKICGALH